MSKKGIEWHTGYDKSGRWCLTVEKKRGKLSLDEIREAARECEWDFYLLVVDAFHEEFDEQFGDNRREGDFVTLYRTDLLYEEGEH